jgi:hypothetical protein
VTTLPSISSASKVEAIQPDPSRQHHQPSASISLGPWPTSTLSGEPIPQLFNNLFTNNPFAPLFEDLYPTFEDCTTKSDILAHAATFCHTEAIAGANTYALECAALGETIDDNLLAEHSARANKNWV